MSFPGRRVPGHKVKRKRSRPAHHTPSNAKNRAISGGGLYRKYIGIDRRLLGMTKRDSARSSRNCEIAIFAYFHIKREQLIIVRHQTHKSVINLDAANIAV